MTIFTQTPAPLFYGSHPHFLYLCDLVLWYACCLEEGVCTNMMSQAFSFPLLLCHTFVRLFASLFDIQLTGHSRAIVDASPHSIPVPLELLLEHNTA